MSDSNAEAAAAAAVTPMEGVEDEQEEEVMSDEQLVEYGEIINELGTRAERVTVMTLSMIAEDYASSQRGADALYQSFRSLLLDPKISPNRKIPILYAIDSLLKNCKGYFISIMEKDVKNWMPTLYQEVGAGKNRETLEKVWRIWKKDSIFSETNWKQMGSCFLTNSSLAKFQAHQATPALRKQMQLLLDEVQADVENELDKVSLQRLEEINPDLLQTIQQQAESMMLASSSQQQSPAVASSGGRSSTNATNEPPPPPVFFTETRTPIALQRSKDWVKEWSKPTLNNLYNDSDLSKQLQSMVVDIPDSGALYFAADAIQMRHALAAAAAAAQCLTNCMESLTEQESMETAKPTNTAGGMTYHYATLVDPKHFTNEGVKTKNVSAVASLYEVGLPFYSQADGRRFKTQLELSNHLDSLFKKNKLDKSMERTDERGWFEPEAVWTKQISQADLIAAESASISNSAGALASGGANTSTTNDDPEQYTEPADETQDKCAICDLPFKMFFDNEEGSFMYKNCKDVNVLMDDAAAKESEQMLVHVTCWRALGSPPELTMDQVLEKHIYK